MNTLPRFKKTLIVRCLVEGMSIRATARTAEVSKNTVIKLLRDASTACAIHHDQTVRDVRAKRVQADEIWSFTYTKQADVEKAKKAVADAGDTWTWTALDRDSKLIISWHIGPRDLGSAYTFMMDLAERLHSRVQLTTDALNSYLSAVKDAFGADVDYSQLIKLYGSEPEGEKRYSPTKYLGTVEKPITCDPGPKHISTSYVERRNLTMPMGMRRFTRLNNAFSKKIENLAYAVALHFAYYNFCRIHKTLRVTPAMAAGLTDRLWEINDIGNLVEAAAPKPGPRGPNKKRQPKFQTDPLPGAEPSLDNDGARSS